MIAIVKGLKAGFIIIITLFITIAAMNGCSAAPSETTDRIVRPGNSQVLLQGTWKVTGYFARETGVQKELLPENTLVGSSVGFSEAEMSLGGKLWRNVSYKVKRVNAAEYFLHKYQGAVDRLGIRDREVLVVTASSQDKYLYEFIITSDGKVFADIDEEYYSLSKLSGQFDKASEQDGQAAAAASGSSAESGAGWLRSGMLLGLRIPETGGYKYETYWIASFDRELHPVITADNIFLPRKDGFWRLEMTRTGGQGGVQDQLEASIITSVSKKVRMKPGSGSAAYGSRPVTGQASPASPRQSKTILYVGNDYVCMEEAYEVMKAAPDGEKPEKVLRTLPVDNLSSTDGIKFSDLAGDNGDLAIEEAVRDLMASSGTAVTGRRDEALPDDQERNFALFRKTGHWFFKGRVNLSGGGPLSYMDFNINLIPPTDMVAYDVLQVPWTALKDRVPQALDAYTSPNRDIAVVITHNSLMVYGVKGSTLSESPEKKLAIPEGSTVVMAEWATGDYVENWEEAFYKNNVVSAADN